MKKLSVIGLFCTGKEAADGQTIKTRIVTDELEKALGQTQVTRIDTYGWKKHPFKLFWKSVLAVWRSSNVIFMTDEGGIKIFPWLLSGANIVKKSALHYIVIGGWLVPFLKKHSFLARCLKNFSGIYVETKAMKEGLEKLGFQNVVLLPNFKNLTLLAENQLPGEYHEPYRLCTFSRVMKEKGVEDAIINLGGNIRVCGVPSKNRTLWSIAIRDPYNPDRTTGEVVNLASGEAVATSGSYERFVIIDGKRYSHIIDPRNGLPVERTDSVTVIAPSAVIADAFSTARFVNGEESARMDLTER